MAAPPLSLEVSWRDSARAYLVALPRRALVAAFAFLIAAGSGLAYWQFTSPFTWHEPYGFWRAWLHPIEWNIDAGLPDVVGQINAVEVIGNRIVIAGNTGLLALSGDEGRSWTLSSYSADANGFSVPPVPTNAAVMRDDGLLRSLAQVLTPRLEAASQASAPSNPAQQRPLPRDGPYQTPVQKGPETPPTGDGLTASPTQWDFGSIEVGAGSQQRVVQFRAGGKAVMAGVPAIVGDETNSFRLIRNECGAALGQVLPGQLCSVFVQFVPARVGKLQAALAYAGLNIPFTGIGTEKAALPTQPTSSKASGAPDNPASTPPNGPASAPSTNAAAAPSSREGGPRIERSPPNLVAFGYCVPSNCELLTQGEEAAFISKDGGLTWQHAEAFEGTSTHGDVVAELNQPAGSLRDAARDPTGDRKWVIRRVGGLFRVDAGQWIPVTRTAAASLPARPALSADARYGRFLPPWYLLLLAACGLLLVPATREQQGAVTEAGFDELRLKVLDVRERNANIPSRPIGRDTIVSDSSAIGNQGTADKPLAPGEPDALGLGIIATGLAFFLRNENTKPPLVIAINGRWGSGKSSLMNLLKSRLQDYGACPVSFNAWHHQQEDQLLAALLDAVKEQAVPPLSGLSGWTFRARLAWRRLQRSWIQLAFALGAILLLWRIEVHLRESGLSIGNALSALLNWTREAPIGPDAERAGSALEAASQLRTAAREATDAALAADLQSQADRFVRLAAQANPNTTFSTLQLWVQDSSLLALIAAVGGGIKALSKGLRAFATNPASLLALDSGSTATKDLEAQTGFRQRFASEFADVTGVLGGNKRMMILIDDLDRCRPEKVREVLEAVNFLCTSGECFVVLGMARNMVEHCVGLSFRRVVDTMPWEAFDLSADEVELFLGKARATSNGTSVDLEAKRLAFARLFLDKLIQIEVSIPEPTPLQKRKLFETEAERREKQQNELRVTKWLAVSRVMTHAMVPVAQALVLFLLIMGGGLYLGGVMAPYLSQMSASQPAPQVEAPVRTPAVQPELRATDASTAAIRLPTPEVLAAATSTLPGWLAPWPFYAALLAAFAMGSLALRRMPHQLVRDEKPFTDAMAIWHPLVMTEGARNTPRTARRFQNRVRYLAMRQRALVLGAPLTRLEGWIRKMLNVPPAQPEPLLVLPPDQEVLNGHDTDVTTIAGWLSQGADGKCALANVKQTPDGPRLEVFSPEISADELRAIAMGEVQIPEPILIALAAIDEMAPDWIADPEKFAVALGKKTSPPGSRLAALAEASARHLAQFKHWHNLTHYRRAYLRLCSELDHLPLPGRASEVT